MRKMDIYDRDIMVVASLICKRCQKVEVAFDVLVLLKIVKEKNWGLVMPAREIVCGECWDKLMEVDTLKKDEVICKYCGKKFLKVFPGFAKLSLETCDECIDNKLRG